MSHHHLLNYDSKVTHHQITIIYKSLLCTTAWVPSSMTPIARERSENSSLPGIWVGWGGGCCIGRDRMRGSGG